MQKEIKYIDKKAGIARITTLDERWYARPNTEKLSGLPTYGFYPSSTWISGYWPKGVPFYKWLATKGWDESQAIKNAAAERGSKIHQATELIDKGEAVKIDQKFVNTGNNQEEELTSDEYWALLTFKDWLDKTKPELLANEMTVFSEAPKYAGTLDRIYRIGDTIWIVDIKTGQNIWTEYGLQLASYSHADIDIGALKITPKEWEARKHAVLQVGYRRNKWGWKFNELPNEYDSFKVAYQIWAKENPDAKPFQRDYPLEIKSELRSK